MKVRDRLSVVSKDDRVHTECARTSHVCLDVIEEHSTFGSHVEPLAGDAIHLRIWFEIPLLVRVGDHVAYVPQPMCFLLALAGANEAVAQDARLIGGTKPREVVG